MRINSKHKVFTGRHALLAFCCFFGSVFAANGVMLYWALTTHAGVETSDAYRRGLAYNERIAAGEWQAEAAWSDTVRVDRGEGRLMVHFVDRNADPVRGLRVSAVVGRPATGKFDKRLDLSEERVGQYVGALRSIDSGAWIVTLSARAAGPDDRVVYRSKRRLWLKP